MSRTNRAVLTALTACIVVVGTLFALAGGPTTASASPSSSDVDALVTTASEPGAAPSPDVSAGVQRRNDRREARRAVVFALLPDALQADITAVRAAPKDQRPAMRAEIMRKALAGEYGDKVKAAAEKLQELRGR
jgi:hypothetical protein